jgi:uncharacterized protein (DUF1501 family)
MHRRDFLKSVIAASAALSIRPALGRPGGSGRVLLAIHLFGGNDGLNTVIPWADPAYRRARPTLAVDGSAALAIGRGLGLHPALRPLLPLWERGRLAIVNGVGYPHPNRSHFVSSAIWQTADRASDGWLGAASGKARWRAFNVDAWPAQAIEGPNTISIRPGDDFHLPDPDPAYTAALRALYGHAPGHVRATYEKMESAIARLAAIHPRAHDDLGRALETVGGLGPGVFHTTARGFDTHSGQAERHAKALGTFAEGLAAFWRGVEARGLADRTLVLVYSEFGRRVEENASGGTDHGTAGPVFLLGGRVRGGLHGDLPSLARLDSGDLRFTVDFRAVYAAILERMLEVDPRPVLGGAFAPLKVIG